MKQSNQFDFIRFC